MFIERVSPLRQPLRRCSERLFAELCLHVVFGQGRNPGTPIFEDVRIEPHIHQAPGGHRCDARHWYCHNWLRSLTRRCGYRRSRNQSRAYIALVSNFQQLLETGGAAIREFECVKLRGQDSFIVSGDAEG